MNNGIMKYSTAALAATLLALTGCGGNDGGGEDSNSSSSVASSSSSSSSSVDSDNWELVWSDEFEGETIDTDKWGFEVNCAGGGNNELQCYTAREDNAQVSDGKLQIITREESYAGPSMFDDDSNYDPEDTSAQRDYTSARLRSKGKGDWKYGRIEINAKMPQGQGIWPALWMLPSDWVYGGWPQSGEIDIFEAVNTNAAGGNEVHGTLHYGFPWPDNRYSGTATTPEANIWEEFHTYAIEWEEGAIHWFVNDTHFATQTSDGWFNYYWEDETRGYKVGDGAAPFDQQFHLIMNIAVGGNWPGSPNEQTQFPQTMEVDYVRVYQCSLDTDTGAGCSTNLDPEISPLPGNPAPTQKEFPLYDNGAGSLTLETADGEVINTLVPGSWQPEGSSNLTSNPAASDGGEGRVWKAEFFGTANIFLTTDDMAETEAVGAGLNLTSMSRYGEIRFDVLVEDKSPDAEIAIKMDSGWPNVSAKTIDPPEGEWTRMSVAIADLEANTTEPGEVDLSTVMNPFVLEVSGGAVNITLRNIVLRCPGDCAVEPILEGQSSVIESPHSVFDDQLDANWDLIGTWDTAGGGHVTTSVVDAEDESRGQVLDIQFSDSSANGIAFIQASSTTKDMSVFSGGELKFDIQVLDYGSASGMAIRTDCIHPCSSGDIDVGMVGASGWETVTLPVADLVAGGLDLSRVNTPLVIIPTWESQANVHLQLDQVRYLAP